MFQRFYCLKHGTTDWWPNQPNLTLQTCPKCRHEDFQEEMEISGCVECGYREERAA
jgi:Zn ribbon nucleic-acid-binding protein